ncbi:MAG: serine/threonine-protein kinase [Nannocystaceae bacterium]
MDLRDTVGERLLGVTTHAGAPDVSDARRRVQALLFGGPLGLGLGGDAAPAKEERIGRFVLLERLGGGGMGVVHRARDPELDREVAIKILRPESSESEAARARLLREAQAMARLSHPNVITVYESGTFEGLVYIAMELVAGVDLRERCAQATGWREVAELYRDAARGLAAAHAVGLIHRDFKPENVMVGDDGRVRVLDFGLARAGDERASAAIVDSGAAITLPAVITRTSAEADTLAAVARASGRPRDALLAQTLTNTGALMGTPAYMAPEQFSAKASSPRSDQFSFCVALYEGLYGVRPFAGETMEALLRALLRGELRPEPAGTLGERAPAALRALVRRGLSVDPEARYATMDALIADLDRALRSGRRRRRALTTTAFVGAALFAGYVGAQRPAAADPCAAGAATMTADVWSPQRQAALAQAFAASGVPQAAAIWERIHGRVDAYVGTWLEGHADACAAATIAGPQGQGLAERRGACLSDARRELAATLALMERADQTIVFHGIQAVADLPELARCADDEALLAAVPPPRDPAVAAAVDGARARASEIRALRRTALYERAFAELTRLRADAAQLDHPPLRAELALLGGDLEFELARFEPAIASYEEAFWAGVDARHDEVAVPAALGLAGVVGARQAAVDAGLAWARQAEALLRRGDLPATSAVALDRVKARILRVAGDYDEARARLDAALERIRAVDGADDLDVAAVVRDLGGVALDQGRPDEAIAFLDEALTRTRAAVGDAHPKVGRALHLLGTAYYSVSRYDDAAATFEAALAIFTEVYGPSHPDVADSLNNLGATLDEVHRFDEAVAAYERALAIRREHLGEAHPAVAATLDNLAYTQAKLGDLDGAMAAMKDAERILVAAHGREHPAVATNLLGQASVARRRGELEEAARIAAEARRIYEATAGAEHPDVAFALIEEVTALTLAGRPGEAVDLARRAVDIRSREGLSPLLAAEARLRLGQALWLAGRERAPAKEMILAAREAFAEIPGEVEKLDAWLAEHGIAPPG